MNKIRYKHSGYLYTYHYHGKTTINELNAGHVPSFVWLPNVSSQLYITFSCLFLLEKKCTQLKKCSLVLCSMFKTNLSFRVLSRRLTDRHYVAHTRPQPCSISCSSPLTYKLWSWCTHHLIKNFIYLGESSFNMTRGDEDIDGGAPKNFRHPKRGLWKNCGAVRVAPKICILQNQ